MSNAQECARMQSILAAHKDWITKAGYAMTTATHLADMAGGLLNAINELAKAEEEVESGARDPNTLVDLIDAKSDYWRAVYNSAHEFRARAAQLAKLKAALLTLQEDGE